MVFSSSDRIHMSKTLVRDLGGKTPSQKTDMKPKGFWYGFGNSWINWVKANEPDWMGEHIYKVHINTTNVLRINNRSDFMRFHEKYKVSIKYGVAYHISQIDWRKVASQYSGIEIVPYLNEFRLKEGYSWYYGWDVASGCVWKSSAVTKLESLTPVPASRPKRPWPPWPGHTGKK